MNNLLLFNICIILCYYIINIKGQDNKIAANTKYCTHLKDIKGNNIIYLDPDKIHNLKNQQYLLDPDLFDSIPDNAKLDYFIRFSVISEGLCYFPSENIKPLNEYEMELNMPNGKIDYLRYEKTVSCIYYYYKYGTPESQRILEKNFTPCTNDIATYLDGLEVILKDEKLCPFPESYETVKTPINNVNTKERYKNDNELKQMRDIYINNIYTEFNIFLNKTECHKNIKSYNKEWTYCGYYNEEMKINYCNGNPKELCCNSVYQSPYKSLEFETKKESIISGVASAVVILLIGSFFSAKYISDIKIQDSMKKSIRNQEKEYKESHKQMMKEAYNQGFDVNKQVFNSKSRNLNSGTLRNTKPNTGTLRSTTGSAVSLARSNVSQARSAVSMTRYPPNTFNIAQEYQGTDSRDISLRKGMVVQLIQQFEGGWVMVKDLKTNRQGFAPEYCLGNKLG